MQEAATEHNRRLCGVILAMASGLVAAAFAHAGRFWAGPTPGQCLQLQHTLGLERHAFGLGGALAAMLVASGVGLGLRARGAGWFGIAAAAVLAAGLPPLVQATVGPTAFGARPLLVAAAAAALAGTVSLGAMPMLRERGLLSLCVVPAIALLPAAVASRAAQLEARAAAPLADLQRIAPRSSPVALVLPAGADPAWVAGLVAGLRQPCFPVDLDVWPVTDASNEQSWLARMGVPSLRLRSRGAELSQADRTRVLGTGVLRPEAGVLRDDGAGARGLWVRAGGLAALGSWVAFTPWGTARGELDAAGSGRFEGEAWSALRGPGRALRGPHRIRVLAMSRSDPPSYGFAELILP